MIVEEFKPSFHFKQFSIAQERAAMKLSTDGVLLGAWTNVKNASKILDIGTGTGILALMMAQKSKKSSTITAVEIDEHACLDAKMNFNNSPFGAKISLFHSSIQQFSLNTSEKFDLIISNPPYYTDGTSSSDSKVATVKHAIKLPHAELLESVSKLLNENGSFNLILPHVEGLKFIKLANDLGLYPTQLTHVISVEGRPIERLLIVLKKTKENKKEDQLIIKSKDNNLFTDKYMSLTKDFYLKFA